MVKTNKEDCESKQSNECITKEIEKNSGIKDMCQKTFLMKLEQAFNAKKYSDKKK